MSAKDSIISIDLLNELFLYRDGQLYWNKTRSNRVRTGEPAGRITNFGYWSIAIKTPIKKYNYLTHRLIFLMHYGYLPKILDHIDGNPLNNRIENLREVTDRQNVYNTKLRSDNTSGYKNVSYHPKYKKWCVRVAIGNKYKNLGYFEDIELADLVATEARDKYRKEFDRKF